MVPGDAPGEAHRDIRNGLLIGGIAAVLALVALPFVARLPFGLLAVNLGLAWGFLSLLRRSWADLRGVSTDAAFVAIASFLPVPFLARLAAGEGGFVLPAPLRATWMLEVLVLGAVLAGLVATHRGTAERRGAAGLLALAGLGVSAALVAFVASTGPAAIPGAEVIWSATLLIGAGLLALQWAAGRRLRGSPWARFGAASALCLAATQLLDGIVSYLSVRDPLGVLATDFTEQMPVSAWLIEHTGPGYVLAKWALALGIVYLLEVRPWPGGVDAPTRVATYLGVAFIGLGPGLFSATRLLG